MASDVRAVLFDLDGTLADTLDDIASAMNRTLEATGLHSHAHSAYRALVGEGVAKLVARVAAERPDAWADLEAQFRVRYAEALVVATRPYDGIPELLDALVARGTALGVVSNKPDPMTQEIMRELFSGWPFRVVLGQRPDIPRKPDPAMLLAVASALGVPPASCAFIGDTAIDMESARAAAMVPIGVAWGFRPLELESSGAALVLERPLDLLDWLRSEAPKSAR